MARDLLSILKLAFNKVYAMIFAKDECIMKMDSIKQVNFKSLFIKDDRFNERERKLADDISKKILVTTKPGDEKSRTWNEWLRQEKEIDVFVKRTPDTFDMLTVYGVKKAKNFDDAEKMKDFFFVGDYYTTDFEPEDIIDAYKSDRGIKIFSIGILALVCLGLIGGIIVSAREKSAEIFKEMPEKTIQIKDSIADTLKITNLIKK